MGYEWFIQRIDGEDGPYSSRELLSMSREGDLAPADRVRRSDMEKWTPASRVKGLEFKNDTRSTDAHVLDGGTVDDSDDDVHKYATTDDGERVRLLINGTWQAIPRAEADRGVGNTTLPAVIAGPNESPEGQYTFRKIRWGVSEREVRDSEIGDPVAETGDALAYATRVAGLSCQAIYIFAQTRCVRTRYLFTEEHSNDNAFIGDYEKVKELLIDKYGRPVARAGGQSDQMWLSEAYMNDPNEWGMAVGGGHLIYQCEWDTPDTAIALVLRGDNYVITMAVEYSSKLLGHLEKAERRRNDLDAL